MPVPLTPQWERFCAAVNRNAPSSPVSISNALQRAQSAAGNSMGPAGAAAAGLNRPLPGAVGRATSLATAGGAQDLADSALDEVLGEAVGAVNPCPVAGAIVGNGIAVLRGALRAVERSDRVEDYLNQLGGYTDALARCSIDAVFESGPSATLPQPPVPSYANRMGRLYSRRTRRSWIRGHARVGTVIREMDQLRPARGDWYSKIGFTHLFLYATGTGGIQGRPETGRQRQRLGETMWRERTRIQEYIVTNILFINELRQARRLRRYGNSG